MIDIESLRYFEQSEMGIYLNEDSSEVTQTKVSTTNRKINFKSAVVALSLLAGSIGLLNYFSTPSSPKYSDLQSTEGK